MRGVLDSAAASKSSMPALKSFPAPAVRRWRHVVESGAPLKGRTVRSLVSLRSMLETRQIAI
jgi:hypothetical protein